MPTDDRVLLPVMALLFQNDSTTVIDTVFGVHSDYRLDINANMAHHEPSSH